MLTKLILLTISMIYNAIILLSFTLLKLYIFAVQTKNTNKVLLYKENKIFRETYTIVSSLTKYLQK